MTDGTQGPVTVGNAEISISARGNIWVMGHIKMGDAPAVAAAILRMAGVPRAEVAVKPLVWEDRGATVDHQFKATTAIGVYYIERSKAGLFNWWTPALRGKIEVKTLVSAKAAAQDDYDARIRSALVDVPAPAIAAPDLRETVKALCEALGAADRYIDKGHYEMARNITRTALARARADLTATDAATTKEG